jgi:hypothetical protein
MGPDGGFAAVLSIGAGTMQGLVRALYAADRITHVVHINSTSSGVSVVADLFLDAPRVGFWKRNNGSFQLDLRLWGPMTVAVGGALSATRKVVINTQVLVPPAISFGTDPQGNTVMNFGLNGPAATITCPINVQPIQGGAWPAAIATILQTNVFCMAFQTQVQNQLSQISPAMLPADFLMGLKTAPALTAKTKINDRSLLIGVDAGWNAAVPAPSGVANSQGDLDRVREFRGNHDAAYWLNDRYVPAALSPILAPRLEDLKQQGIEVTQLDITVQHSAIHFEGNATSPEGSASFSFDAVPVLTSTELLFQQRNASVSLEVPWYLQFAEAITFGFTAPVVEILLASIRNDLERRLGGSNPVQARKTQFTLANTSKPTIDQSVERCVILTTRSRRGLFAGLSLRPNFRASRIYAQDRARFENGAWQVDFFYSVTLPEYVLRTDPLLRVRWTVRRLDNNTVIDEVDDLCDKAKTYRKTLTVSGMENLKINVACTLYRTLGRGISERLFHDVIRREAARTDISPLRQGRLDTSFPFVEWKYQALVPFKVKQSDGSLTTLFPWPAISRVSRIHKTDFRKSCLFSWLYSDYAAPVTYLKELPFPAGEIKTRRAILCDYCFFGGPSKTEPLPL